MARFVQAIIQEQRRSGRFCWLTLYAPELSAGVRAGHYLLVRCADPRSSDPLLRRAIFVAGVDLDVGTLTVLYTPQERGMIWLARQHAGTPLDLFGPLGTPFALDTRTRTLLLIGLGEGLGALFLLAQAALCQNAAVVLLTAAPTADLLPPPFLLPAAVEYRGSDAGERSIVDLLYGDTAPENRTTATSELIAWADQIGATLPSALLPTLISAVRTTRLRWQRGFAQVILPAAMPCGTGACLGCLIETHAGMRTCCKDGPVFDLRDLQAGEC